MRSARSWTVMLGALACPLIAACGWNDRTAEIASAIRELTSAKPTWSAKPAVWSDVAQFYGRRNFAPAWIEQGNLGKAEAALHVLQSAIEHGLEPSDYGERDVRRLLE